MDRVELTYELVCLLLGHLSNHLFCLNLLRLENDQAKRNASVLKDCALSLIPIM